VRWGLWRTVLMTGWSLVFFPLLDTGNPGLIVMAITFGVAAWSVLYGVQGAYLCELFPARVRYTGASLATRSPAPSVGSCRPWRSAC
jgi:hypothetical protein